MSILRFASHENIVGVCDVVVDRYDMREVGLALEYCESDLCQIMYKERIIYSLGQGERRPVTIF